MDLVWNYFDKIYVLTDDVEKLEGIKNNLEYVGMTKYEIVKFENVKEVENDIDKAIVEDDIYDIRTRMGIINMEIRWWNLSLPIHIPLLRWSSPSGDLYAHSNEHIVRSESNYPRSFDAQ